MDRADVIRLAQQANPEWLVPDPEMCSDEVDDIERFAALVRAQVIEQAAQTVEAMVHGNVRTCAAAIRGMKSDSVHPAAADAGASTAPLPGYPRTPQAIREFIGPHFRSREDAKPAPEGSSAYDGEATEDDVYTLTVHDLLSAFDWWADLPPEWMKPHPQCDQVCMYVCTEGFTRFPSCVGAECEHGQEKPSCGLCHDNALANVYGGRTASTGADNVSPGSNEQAESASPSVLLIRGEK